MEMVVGILTWGFLGISDLISQNNVVALISTLILIAMLITSIVLFVINKKKKSRDIKIISILMLLIPIIAYLSFSIYVINHGF